MHNFSDPVPAFREAMAAGGIPSPPAPVPDGQLHRFHVEGDSRGSRNGFYVLYADTPPAGAFGCWKRGIHETWSAKPEREFNAAERDAWRERMEKARRAREEAEREERDRAASRARKIWEKAAPADPEHPYMKAKGVKPYGIRQSRDRLLVPVTASGERLGLQFIGPDGSKRFIKGTPKRGAYFPIGQAGDVLAIVEGYSTGATVHEATGLPVVVAFDAGNLRPVAEAMRERFPEARIVIAGDNDHGTDGNPGRTAAEDAAQAVEGVATVPEFAPGDSGTDWNDYGAARGLPAVKAAIEDATAPDEDELPRAVALADLPPAEPIEWFQAGCIPAREPVLIVADGGAGKTTFLLATLGAAAAGVPAHGHRQWRTEEGPVLFVSEEDPGHVIENRLAALGAGMGWDMERVRSRFHVLALAGVQLDRPVWRDHLLAEVERLRPVAVGLDPYSDLTAAKENDNDETKPFKRLLREIAARGATPIVAHHLGKMVEGKRKQDRIRGASALDHASRCTLYLSSDDAGIRVEWLKLSRAEPPRPFVLQREIETEPGNVGMWTRARLTYMTEAAAEEDVAEDFIRAQLTRTPGLNSTELRDCAKGSGVSGAALAAAQRRMEGRGEIRHEPGARNAKFWHLATLPEDSRQARQGTLPNLPDPARQGREDSDDPAHSYREAGSGGDLEPPGRQAEQDVDPDDLLSEMEEAAA